MELNGALAWEFAINMIVHNLLTEYLNSKYYNILDLHFLREVPLIDAKER